MEGVDEAGLDSLDRKYLRTIVEQYAGGPVGVEAIAATMNEEADTLVDMVEPFLLRTGLVQRTRGGRRAVPAAYAHLGVAIPTGAQRELWSSRAEGEDAEESA